MQSNNKLNKGFLCLHLGAGFHSETKRDLYKKVCEDALQLGVNLLNNQSTCVEVVTKLTSFLENSQLTNAGFGSNLTINGTIECEAAIMESAQNRFGAVGCVKESNQNSQCSVTGTSTDKTTWTCIAHGFSREWSSGEG